MLNQLVKREFDFYFYLLFYFPFSGTAHNRVAFLFVAFFILDMMKNYI